VNQITKSASPSCNRDWLFSLLLIAATLVAYWPAMHGGFIWDDDAYVTKNLALQSVRGLEAIWLKPEASSQYYPLVFTSFWVEYHLWKLNPLGYHLVNILLHASNVILLWLVLRRLQIKGAWWAAAIFAVHPVMVESVAWITERKNLLSGLFYLLAVLVYLRFRPLTNGATASTWNWRRYPWVLALFLCALLSKTVTCSLPAALMLLVWWKRGWVEKRDWLALTPLFVLGAGLGLMTAWLEKFQVGANGADWALSFVQRCLLAGRALWFYAGKLVCPYPLSFVYPRWQIEAGNSWAYLFVITALGVVVALWLLRRRIGRGPLVGVLFFAGTLGPALGFANVYYFRYSFVADHFQYLAAMGLLALAAAGMATALNYFQPGRPFLGTGLGGMTLLVLGLLTWRQCGMYTNLETLWRATIARNPGCWMAYDNLGKELFKEDRIDEAISQFQKAMRLWPNDADAHCGLGVTLGRKGQFDEAINQIQEAIRLKPGYPEAYCNLGTTLGMMGRIDEAISQFREAIRLKPDYAEAYCNLGTALLMNGQIDEAICQYQEAIRLNPDYAEAHYGLGTILGMKGQTDEAINQFQEALRLKPDYAEARRNLAHALELKNAPANR
jgi:protein O-mannosyl-transferase